MSYLAPVNYPIGATPGAAVVTADGSPAAAVARLPDRRSRFDAPPTVRVSASRPAGSDNEIDVHFVNYDRTEPPPGPDGKPGRGGGIRDEKPRPVSAVVASVLLPPGAAVRSVRFVTPEQPHERPVDAAVADGRAKFTVPPFLVYGVARLELEPRR